MTTARLRQLDGNPLLDAHRRWAATDNEAVRAEAIARYALAVPTEEAIAAIAAHAPAGVVEVGAGTGYWARLLADRGTAVVAFDVAPPPDAGNHFFAGAEPWYPVAEGDEDIAAAYPERTLLLVWPTRESWPTDALRVYAGAGGQRVAYVGEGPGGRMGDDQLHAALGLVEGCVACDYGIPDVSCVCHVERQWRLLRAVTLPNWGGYRDDLYLFDRR